MGFQNLAAAFAWIESFTNLERSVSLFSPRTYQLDRMRALCAASGDPQRASRTVHLAGTKGKGSTAIMIAESLRHAGLRTGLYTSPHVSSYEERIRVLPAAPSTEPEGPPKEVLLAQAGELQRLVEALPEEIRARYGPPSTFELLTLLAFCSFRAVHCDIVVVETGIGGRLDATNLLLPELAVITPIELEHTEVLGDTVAAIAREKAGIFKPGVPAICAAQPPEAESALRAAARERGCPISFVNEELAGIQAESAPDGTRVRITLRDGTRQELGLAMLGTHQAENAALAFLALRRLEVPAQAIAAGCAAALLPARMELLRHSPPVMLDGAHTPLSVARVLESFRALFPAAGVLLFAAAADKRIAEMASILAPAFRAVVITTTGSQRESRPHEVHGLFSGLNPDTEMVPDPAAALRRALERAAPDRPLLITGSFYLAGEIRRAWTLRAAPGRGERGGRLPREGAPVIRVLHLAAAILLLAAHIVFFARGLAIDRGTRQPARLDRLARSLAQALLPVTALTGLVGMVAMQTPFFPHGLVGILPVAAIPVVFLVPPGDGKAQAAALALAGAESCPYHWGDALGLRSPAVTRGNNAWRTRLCWMGAWW